MKLPFTLEQFLQVFREYNEAIWPAQLLAYGLGIIAAFLAWRAAWPGVRVVLLILAAMWAFNGIGYHLMFFAEINGAARLFGALFLVQAVLLLLAVGWVDRETYPNPLGRWLGLAAVLYAMVVYPLLGLALGHVFPQSPVFGVAPCPTTIFTLGMLMMLKGRVSWALLIVPLLWAVVGTSAALSLGMREDVGLPVFALLALWVAFVKTGQPKARITTSTTARPLGT